MRGAANLTDQRQPHRQGKRSGVSVASAGYIDVTGNLLLQNAQSGLAVRDSAGLKVSANRLIDNGNAGISVTHQPDYGVIEIASSDSTATASASRARPRPGSQFAMNDFTGRAPRLLDGELVQFIDRSSTSAPPSSTPTIIDGLQLKAGAKLTPTGALPPH